jgi:RND family efflux transporter MFP subunit
MWQKAVLPFMALLIAGCSSPSAEEAVHYQVVRAMQVQEDASYTIDRFFVGEVSAKQQSDIGFELPGSIIDLAVAEGDAVKAGSVMAVQDTRLLLLEEKELKASLAETEARLDLAQSSLKRQSDLQVSGYSAEQRIDESRAQVKQLSATVNRLEAALEANSTRKNKARMIAPFDGVVSKRYVDKGAVVAAGAPVIQLLQGGAMELEVGVPVRLANQMTIGNRYPAEVNSVQGTARLIALGANINVRTRTVPAWFSLENIIARDGELAGITLRETREQTGYWIPVTAVTEGMRGTWVVYGLSRAGGDLYEIERHAVDVLYTQGDQFFVTGSLGDIEIVSGGLHRIVPGQQVRVGDRVTASESR